MSVFGKRLVISLFGESHGPYVGISIHHFPAGLSIDNNKIKEALSRRSPKNDLSTSRREVDDYQFISGVFNGKTTGAPLTVIIPNKDTLSKDYTPNLIRPSHADYTAFMKYNGYNDYRGGGHFSGRLTAPLVVLGALCDQILEKKNILVSSHIASIKDINDDTFTPTTPENTLLKTLKQSDFPVINPKIKTKFEALISETKKKKDSVGGTIETIVTGILPGYGTPFFDKVESIISHLIFSIPSVKALEFGAGFSITKHFGSVINDSFTIEENTIKTNTNNSGGILGGITTGMPIIFKTAIKPTPSIGKKQNTVDIKTRKNTTISIKGRHDPTIVHRVIHVINALTSYAIVELLLERGSLYE